MSIKYRVEFSKEELGRLKELVEPNSVFADDTLYAKLVGAKEICITDKKRKATKNANKTKIKQSKEKIQNAINLLMLENVQHFTITSIAKTSNLSYSTVKKYETLYENNPKYKKIEKKQQVSLFD